MFIFMFALSRSVVCLFLVFIAFKRLNSNRNKSKGCFFFFCHFQILLTHPRGNGGVVKFMPQITTQTAVATRCYSNSNETLHNGPQETYFPLWRRPSVCPSIHPMVGAILQGWLNARPLHLVRLEGGLLLVLAGRSHQSCTKR